MRRRACPPFATAPILAILIAVLVQAADLSAPPAASAAKSGPTPAAAPAATVWTLVVDIEAGSPALVATPSGLRLELPGGSSHPAPGMPLLPAITRLYLLPPGTRAVGVTATPLRSRELPGRHALARAPAYLPLVDPTEPDPFAPVRQALAEAAGAPAGGLHPAAPARLLGTGGFRQYAYAAVAWCPFVYDADGGGLTFHEEAELTIHLAPAGTAAATIPPEPRDAAAAAARFANHAALAHRYPAPTPRGDRDEPCDYLVLAPPALEATLLGSGFLEWKESLGHATRLVRTDDPGILAQPGVDAAERIRNWLRANYLDWGLRHLLIVGDIAAVPMRYCFPNPDDHSHNPGNPANDGYSVPTDHYYTDLSLPDAVSWDLDGDGYHGEWGDDLPDFVAEIAVGRIPSSIPSRVAYTLEKLIRFEQDEGPWKDRALHGAAVLFHENQDGMDIPFRDGAVCMQLVDDQSMPGWPLARLCEHDGLVPSDYPWGALTEAMFTSFWRGGQFGVVNWAGHGSPDAVWRLIWTWDDGDGIFETDGSDGYDWSAFTADWSSLEDDHPGVVFAVSCNIGYPEPNPAGNLGIDLLTKPGFGAAAAVLSSTRSAHVSAYWPQVPGGAESICCEFNRFFIAEDQLIGDALNSTLLQVLVDCGWESYAEYKTLFDYNLYGDPAMHRRGVVTAVADGPAADRLGLASHPNPFGETTRIEFAAPGGGSVELAIFDVRGRRVASYAPRTGGGAVVWDGRDGEGRALPAGVYLVRLRAGGREESLRVVRLR